jgi:hypothetical protein
MSNPQSTFNIGLQVAIEENYSEVPGTSTNGFYWQGGKWIPISTPSTPDLWDRQETIFPAGRAGSRAMYNRKPVVGRKWSDGDFDFELTSDFFPAIAYGALGSLSTNEVPSTDPLLLAEEPIQVGASKQLVLATQPSDGGATLRFSVNGTSVGGWISVSGIDAEGNGASEVISFTSAGSMYTRTSFSAIGPSSITMWSDNEATLDIHGFQYWEHIISINNTSNPSFSIQKHGDPTAGATSIMRVLPGMVVTEFELDTPAEARDGLVTGSVSWEGNPTATCAKTDLPAVSSVQVWPAWVASVKREGIAYDKVLDFSFTFTAGNRNYRTAAGTQNPQGAVYLTQMVDGSMRLFLEDESEYNRWQGASANNMVMTWNSPFKLTSAVTQSFTASMNALYFQDVDAGDDNDLQILEVDFMTIRDAENGILKMSFINNVPGSAYSW